MAGSELTNDPNQELRERIRLLEQLAEEHKLGTARLGCEPMAPVHVHEEYPEHDWRREEDGTVDRFAYEVSYCNGPVCERCGWSFCTHCNPNGWTTPCVIDEYLCPVCGRKLYGKDTRCDGCGQAIDRGDGA